MSAPKSRSNVAPAPVGRGHLLPSDFKRLSQLVYETSGIQLDASKQVMVEARLQRRLKQTGIPTLAAYWKYLSVEENRQRELVSLIDVITTNKTDFFREPDHFNFLAKTIVPQLTPRLRAEGRPLQIWSAACSTGKEAYTIAMVLSECRREGFTGDFSILGTDISTEVLKEAERAVYPERVDLDAIPVPFRKRYLLKSRSAEPATFRMSPEIRANVKFQRLNFMDSSYGLDNRFDVIFCRNVMIYFDRPTQQDVVNKCVACMRPGGYYITGHSETLNGLDTCLTSVAPTIYRAGKDVS